VEPRKGACKQVSLRYIVVMIVPPKESDDVHKKAHESIEDALNQVTVSDDVHFDTKTGPKARRPT
jgi:hypothetical protein